MLECAKSRTGCLVVFSSVPLQGNQGHPSNNGPQSRPQGEGQVPPNQQQQQQVPPNQGRFIEAAAAESDHSDSEDEDENRHEDNIGQPR